MKIYLAVAAVGGWSLLSLSRFQESLLISYHYDRNTLEKFEEECLLTDEIVSRRTSSEIFTMARSDVDFLL